MDFQGKMDVDKLIKLILDRSNKYKRTLVKKSHRDVDDFLDDIFDKSDKNKEHDKRS
ncbi:hypothetical protein ACQKJC_08670 [Priestia koreensis]|uniref:hypothetical protein n=1 Tax=Priestia koreensis TaxID=284581 RepID=UPI003CFE6199